MISFNHIAVRASGAEFCFVDQPKSCLLYCWQFWCPTCKFLAVHVFSLSFAMCLSS